MTHYKWTVEIEVHPDAVAGGFDVGKFVERNGGLSSALSEMGNAAKWLEHGEEATVRVTAAPDPAAIRREQGY